jgi:hypothetical protein
MLRRGVDVEGVVGVARQRPQRRLGAFEELRRIAPVLDRRAGQTA